LFLNEFLFKEEISSFKDYLNTLQFKKDLSAEPGRPEQ